LDRDVSVLDIERGKEAMRPQPAIRDGDKIIRLLPYRVNTRFRSSLHRF
jgi:hypothetical protein